MKSIERLQSAAGINPRMVRASDGAIPEGWGDFGIGRKVALKDGAQTATIVNYIPARQLCGTTGGVIVFPTLKGMRAWNVDDLRLVD